MDHERRPRAWAVIAWALLVPILPFVIIGELPGERWLQAAPAHGLGLGAAGASLLVIDILLPIPSSIVGALLGSRLGFTHGFAWTWAGLCVGHALGFALGRLAPARFGHQYPRVPSLAIVFASRSVPVLSEAVAIAAGVERLPVLAFLASAALGNAVYAGAIAGGGAPLLPADLPGAQLLVPFLIPVLAYALWQVRAAGSGRIAISNPLREGRDLSGGERGPEIRGRHATVGIRRDEHLDDRGVGFDLSVVGQVEAPEHVAAEGRKDRGDVIGK